MRRLRCSSERPDADADADDGVGKSTVQHLDMANHSPRATYDIPCRNGCPARRSTRPILQPWRLGPGYLSPAWCLRKSEASQHCHPAPIQTLSLVSSQPAGLQPHPLSRNPARPVCLPLVQYLHTLAGVARGHFLLLPTLPDALPMWLLCALTCSPSLQLPQSAACTSPTSPDSALSPRCELCRGQPQ